MEWPAHLPLVRGGGVSNNLLNLICLLILLFKLIGIIINNSFLKTNNLLNMLIN